MAPGVVVRRTGGHAPGHAWSGWRQAVEALTFAGDAVFTVGFEHPDWHNGFEHDPEEAARVRVKLLRELANPARCWWPPICRSHPSAGSRLTAACSALCLPSGITEIASNPTPRSGVSKQRHARLGELKVFRKAAIPDG